MFTSRDVVRVLQAKTGIVGNSTDIKDERLSDSEDDPFKQKRIRGAHHV